MNKLLIIFSYITLLSGCSFLESRICDYEKYERTPLNQEKLDPISPRNVEWIIITENNSAEVFKKLKDKNVDPILIGLTDNQYEFLSLNLNEIIQYIEKLNQQNLNYKEYYEPAEK